LTVQRFQLSPLLGLRFADELERHLRENGLVAVKAVTADHSVAARQQMGFDDGLEILSPVGSIGISASS